MRFLLRSILWLHDDFLHFSLPMLTLKRASKLSCALLSWGTWGGGWVTQDTLLESLTDTQAMLSILLTRVIWATRGAEILAASKDHSDLTVEGPSPFPRCLSTFPVFIEVTFQEASPTPRACGERCQVTSGTPFFI